MNHHVRLALALPISLFACDAGVTNLGSAREVSAPLVDTTTSIDDAGVASDAADAETANVQWRVWLPIADEEQENVYLLPVDPEAPDFLPFQPANWDLAWARIEITEGKTIGNYKSDASACGEDHGWYFADGDQTTATRYSLCPQSRALVTRPSDFGFALRW